MLLLLFGPGVLVMIAFVMIPRAHRGIIAYTFAGLGCLWLVVAAAFVCAVNVGWLSP